MPAPAAAAVAGSAADGSPALPTTGGYRPAAAGEPGTAAPAAGPVNTAPAVAASPVIAGDDASTGDAASAADNSLITTAPAASPPLQWPSAPAPDAAECIPVGGALPEMPAAATAATVAGTSTLAPPHEILASYASRVAGTGIAQVLHSQRRRRARPTRHRAILVLCRICALVSSSPRDLPYIDSNCSRHTTMVCSATVSSTNFVGLSVRL